MMQRGLFCWAVQVIVLASFMLASLNGLYFRVY